MRYLITKPNEKPFFAVELTEELLTDSVVYDLVDDKYSTPGGWSKIKFDLDYKLELNTMVRVNNATGYSIIRAILNSKTDTPAKNLLNVSNVYDYSGSNDLKSIIEFIVKSGSEITAECTDKGNFVHIKTSIQLFDEFTHYFLNELCKHVPKNRGELIVRSYVEKCLKLLRKGKYNRHY